jgi:hypothetical protein
MVVHSYGGETLLLPRHQLGSVTSVIHQYGYQWPQNYFTENADGSLWSGNTTGFVLAPWYPGRFTIIAKWGPGSAPQSLVEVVLEVAVNLWREKDKGSFSDVIGVEGDGAVAVGYQRAFTNRQKAVIEQIKRLYGPLPVV